MTKMTLNKRNYLLYGIKLFFTILLLIFLLSVWPGYLVHDYFLSKTNSSRSTQTNILLESSVVTQYFIPQSSYLSEIQFALKYNEEVSLKDKELYFELCSEDGTTLLSKNIPIEEIKSGCYYNVPINKKLKTGKVYSWSLVIPDDNNYQFQLMYTEYKEDQASENILFLIDGIPYNNDTAQSVSQYEYFSHPDKMIILGVYWISGILIYIVCLEVINRCFKINKSMGCL